MAITSQINLDDLKNEFTNFLRVNLTDSRSRITEVSQYFSGDDSTVLFTPTNTSSYQSTVYVKIDGTTQTYGDDYTVNWVTGAITFTTAPASGSNNIELKYGYGTSAMVFPDMPREDLRASSYPRVGWGLSMTTDELSVGGQAFKTDLRFTVLLLGEDALALDQLVEELRNAVQNNRTGFYNFRYIYPSNVANITVSEDISKEILGRVVELVAPDRYEIIT